MRKRPKTLLADAYAMVDTVELAELRSLRARIDKAPTPARKPTAPVQPYSLRDGVGQCVLLHLTALLAYLVTKK